MNEEIIIPGVRGSKAKFWQKNIHGNDNTDNVYVFFSPPQNDT